MNEIDYELREQDLIAFNEHMLAESGGIQKQMRRHQAQVPGIIVVISLFLWFYYQDTLSAVYVAAIALAWGFGVPFYLKSNVRRQIRRAYTDEEKSSLLGRRALRIEKDSLVEIDRGNETKTPWSDMLRIETTKQYAFLFVSTDAAVIVPRATITRGNLHEFVKAADERIEQADSGTQKKSSR